MISTPTRHCRCCGNAGALETVLSLGQTPLADRLVEPRAPLPDPTAPLGLVWCRGCGLVQLAATVPPAMLFGTAYRYAPSTSSTLRLHVAETAQRLVRRFALAPGACVVEAGSNDGMSIGTFQALGYRVLGIDPAPGPAAAAIAAGIPTRIDFFSSTMAAALTAEGWRADLFVGNNVLAHVPNPLDFLAGIELLLAPGGIAVLEVAYLGDMLRLCAFDTIYHQHVCYFSARAAQALFARAGLTLFDIERTPAQGGSLRLFARRGGPAGASVDRLVAEENSTGLNSPATFERFAARVAALARDLRRLLDHTAGSGMSIAGYGAAAKATTLMAAAGITARDVPYIADRNAAKHGAAMPGVRIPIVPVEALAADPPDAVLVFPWNLAHEIARELEGLIAAETQLILPIPVPRIVALRAVPAA